MISRCGRQPLRRRISAWSGKEQMAARRGLNHLSIRTLGASYRFQMRLNLATPNYISAVFLQPCLLAIISGLVFRAYGRPQCFSYVVTGAGMFGALNSNLYVAGGIINGERRYGTLEYIITTRSSLFTIVIGKALASASFSLLAFGVSAVSAALTMGQAVIVSDALSTMVSLFACMASLVVLGLMLGTLFFAVRHYQRVNDFFYLIFIASGLMFPTSMLPAPIRVLSCLLPTTWSTEALRISMTGQGRELLASRWVYSGILTVVYLAASIWLYEAVMRFARANARFGRY